MQQHSLKFVFAFFLLSFAIACGEPKDKVAQYDSPRSGRIIISVDESVANINIRGGTHDQNLFLWNNIRMFQTGHFFGLISAFSFALINISGKVLIKSFSSEDLNYITSTWGIIINFIIMIFFDRKAFSVFFDGTYLFFIILITIFKLK